jgi:hypothetical protein
MNTALVVITHVSVGTTAVLLLYAMRLLRDERDRSEARVAALSDAIASSTTAPLPLAREVARDAGGRSPFQPHTSGTLSRDADSPHVWPGPRAALPVPDIDARVDEEPAAGAPLLFSAHEEPASARSRLLAPLVGALIVAVVLGGIYVMSARSSAGASAVAAAPAVAAPLELLSLRHVRQGDTLTISGLVRNPPDGRMQAGVTAVVFLFDKAGTFPTRGRAPLDYQRLTMGDESPFVVTIPKAGAVARYRVSFRTEKDVVPHIDRRAGPIAP